MYVTKHLLLTRTTCKVISVYLHNIQALEAPPLVDAPPEVTEPAAQPQDTAPTFVGKDPDPESFAAVVLDDYDLPFRKKRRILVCD